MHITNRQAQMHGHVSLNSNADKCLRDAHVPAKTFMFVMADLLSYKRPKASLSKTCPSFIGFDF